MRARATEPWLRGAPRLRTANWALRNRGPGKARRYLMLGLGLIVAWAIMMALCFSTRHDASASTLAWMYRHRLFLGGVAAFASAVLTARRRALERAAAARSWLSALPIHPATARWETVVIETAPLVAAIGASAAAFAIVWVFAAGIPKMELVATCVAINTGAVVGALLSYLAPAPKAVDLPPGSRYVPQRRRVGASSPIPSLSALGRWPVRQMFASARPKAVVRAVIPILLLMPLGSSADTAMLVIAAFAAMGAILLLVAATISVSNACSRWLQPLPLKVVVLACNLMIRPLAVIFCATSVAVWLWWVMGVAPGRAVARGALLMMLSSVMAVAGSLGAIYRTTKGRR
jgi:hypothetical protein